MDEVAAFFPSGIPDGEGIWFAVFEEGEGDDVVVALPKENSWVYDAALQGVELDEDDREKGDAAVDGELLVDEPIDGVDNIVGTVFETTPHIEVM